MKSTSLKSFLVRSALAASALLGASEVSFAQTQQVNLVAAPTTLTPPDGSLVPMWGYSCGSLASGSTATCAALNTKSVTTPASATAAAVGTWSPVVITIPYTGTTSGTVTTNTTTLQINLTNSLAFTPTGTTTANNIPTSLMIVGQLGGGFGTVGGTTATGKPCTGGTTCTDSPTHNPLVVTWSTVGSSPAFTPPPQGPRVQSFGTEVAVGATTALCWGPSCATPSPALNPGTYLIESGTHPSIQVPMGLYGILVVTTAPAAPSAGTTTATAGVAYPGYTPPTLNGVAGVAVPPVTYNAEVPMAFGEIDPVQNSAVYAAVNTSGFKETNVWSGQPGMCGNPLSTTGTQNTTTYNTCYPPAVNYKPLYYTINGVAFDRTHASNSLFPVTQGTATGTIPSTGTVLVRLVNAGSKMHLPSIVGAQTTQLALTTGPLASTTTVPGFSLIAEDGNRLPGVPHVQSDVFMSAGKTYDVMINVPAAGTTAIPIFDRELSLSGNATERDAGMLAYIGVNGAVLPTTGAFGASSTTATANADTYNSVVACAATALSCTPVVVSDPGKGVIANDVNVYGVTLLTAPTNGSVTLNHNGTFTYTPKAGTASDSFTYCANGSVSTIGTTTTCSSGLTATVTLGAAAADGTVTVLNPTFTANTATYIQIRNPGVLAGATDSQGYPLTLNTTTASTTAGLTLVALDANGGFTATAAGAGACASSVNAPVGATCGTFTFQAKSTQGGTASGTATVIFPKGSGLQVTVQDPVCAQAAAAAAASGGTAPTCTATIKDYRWVIEEDETFYVDPNARTRACAAGVQPGTPGCPIVPTFGVNFHTSHMPFVAQGCTGTLSCEGGQTAINPANGQHTTVVCDVGAGACRPDTAGAGSTPVDPSQVVLDPTKRYYISVLPGDAANPFGASGYGGAPDCSAAGFAAGHCGHGMGGTPIPAVSCAASAGGATICTWPTTGATCTAASATTPCTPAMAVTALTQPSPYPPSKLSVFVFQDDFPLNGEHDAGGAGTTTGGADTLAPNEPGLGGFQIHLWDAMGGNGDFTGQMTYDMFNMPLTNSLDGIIDPATGKDACPITQIGVNSPGTNAASGPVGAGGASTTGGITGMIVTCPKYESDGVTLSPLAGQAVIANLMPMRVGVIATPGADRIARGEEWLQTNTLDGQKAHDAFARIGEPSFFQEFGPASFHVSIGFANPAIINARLAGVCNGTDPFAPNYPAPVNCTNTVTGLVTSQRLSRTPDERLYSSATHDAFAWTQCFVSVGDPDGEDFAFAKCNADGTFTLTGLPDGDWRITTFDQWNDQLVDGLSTPVRLGAVPDAGVPGGNVCPGTGSSQHTCNMGDIASTQWETNLQTKTFIDDNADGIAQGTETGIPFANVAVRLRDGSLENLLVTDFTGAANFNETFPLFSWYTVETDVTRYKNTGTHVVYDVGGPADGTLNTCGGSVPGAGYPPCGNSTIAKNLANTAETVSVPTNLRVPGSVYCAGADCTGKSIRNGSSTSDSPSSCTTTAGVTTCSNVLSSGRIDNPWYGGVEGWQGFPGQFSFLEFGKEPYVAGENGGIKGHVIYASTRPFDDPMMLVQTQWEPLVPHVRINLYQEGFAADGVTPTLKLVDWTTTSSFDDWAQGFNTLLGGTGSTPVPNMNCPGQSTADLFYFTLFNQPAYLDYYNNVQHGTAAAPAPLPNNSQFKCYDGMHNWNQVQPVPYDGMYKFPSVTAVDATGKPTLTGTNCTICGADPVTAPDLYAGVPMLPAGKYVVEVVLPAGFELVKEEDKNILIGDDFIGAAVNEFAGNATVFIMPDQASVASQSLWASNYPGPAYNANSASVSGAGGNGFNSTVSLGTTPQNGIVPGFIPEPIWPCVGEVRIVPDYISLYPQTKQVSPFAGASRALCDRKEVTLSDQMGAIAKFFVYTSTHVASKFTGGITDDYTSEFDPFSPQFGEKFAPPDLPVAVKDWTGQEISRVYADQWGAYNGLTYSTWEVNPPNPTGYSPTMMVMCMNDPGPVLDTRQTVVNSAGATVLNPTLGQKVTDPLFTQGYSQFCYELPFMPATTQYLDTPVVPTSAFAGAGYNNADCAYPALTPAISEVDGDGVGPWVSAAGHQLTIKALGDFAVPNNAYNGPSATAAPYNQKTIVRHYGFGATQGTVALVGADGVAHALTGVSWGDLLITGNVPQNLPNCLVQQQSEYSGSTAQCGQLVITTAPTSAGGQGLQSVDTVTVTVGGKAPTHVTASGSIQAAIDGAAPGDLIMVDPAVHTELVLMWKPVRLQGVGATSSLINANTHPAGRMDPWRREVTCLFGLGINGYPLNAAGNSYDPTGTYSCTSTQGPNGAWKYFVGNTPITGSTDGSMDPQVDRLVFEAVLGWDAAQNGNMAELLQEPSLMGALEGAGITVLAKGVKFPNGATNIFGASNGSAAATAGIFPAGTTILTAADCTSGSGGTNPHPSSFLCNPASIDGLGIANSSQGGGGIFVHAWGHNLQIANNRIQNNSGTLSGGINVGQGEFAPANTVGGLLTDPGSCDINSQGATNALIKVTVAVNAQEPYCSNVNVNIHHNSVSLNSSTGDELFSATPAGAGGVSICTGADLYKFKYNWVCGNLSSGDGGGLGHLGFSYNGDIEHNSILFNQSLNPTIPANGGGMVIMGTPDADPTCSALTDADCVAPPGSITPSDGVGPGLVINANLIQGNAAEAGTGGGIAFQALNGSDVLAFPGQPSMWNHVRVTNNVIVDNVAGWDGGGVSFEDALYLDFINNTVANNNSTATAGVLNNTLGAPLASQQNPNSQCTSNCGTNSIPQPAGLVVIQNDAVLSANIALLTNPTPPTAPTPVVCPPGHYAGANASDGTCVGLGYPLLANDIFYNNASFQVGIGSLSAAYQQNIVTIYNASFPGSRTSHGGAVSTQSTTGQCFSNSSYWDIGVRGDLGPTNHTSGITLNPAYSIIGAGGYGGTNSASAPGFVSPYCDGARQPPESGASGWNVPPGISDATVPNPIFNLTPVATVDEGNNWINLRWGPLTTVRPVANGAAVVGSVLGNYAPATGSNNIPTNETLGGTAIAYPTTDFFGNSRPEGGGDTVFDAGAIEAFGAPAVFGANVTPATLAFGSVAGGTTTAAQTVTLHNTGGTPVAISLAFTGPYSRATTAQGGGGSCGTTLNSNATGTATCTINIVFNSPTTTGSANGSVAVNSTSGSIGGSPMTLTGTSAAAVSTATLTPATRSYGTVTRGSTTGPTQVFTLTNTGNVTMTGVADAVLAGTNPGDFFIVQTGTTCGPPQAGRMLGTTTLTPATSQTGAHSCMVTVQFRPTTATTDPAGNKSATLSVTDSFGTQTTTANGLTGTAN